MTSSHLTYVVSRWGEPTQTFVRREAEALLADDVIVSIVSMKRPLPTPLDSRVRVRWKPPWRVVIDAGRTALRSPGDTARRVAAIIRHAAPRNIPTHLAALAVGLAWRRDIPSNTEVVHAHFGWVAATATWAMAPRRFGVTLHAFEIHSRRVADDFAGIPLRDADLVLVIAESDRELVQSRWGVRPEVYRMGVPVDWVRTTVRDVPEQRVIVSVGSLVRKKGHDVLIRALPLLEEGWAVEIIGEGPERESLGRLTEQVGAGRSVRFRGRLSAEEVRSVLDDGRVFVLACRVDHDGNRDGIPVAIMEAMARGLPVVTTPVGGIRELVDDAGMLVPPDDPVAVADAIAALGDDITWSRLSMAGPRRIGEDWTSEVNARHLLRLHGLSRGVVE